MKLCEAARKDGLLIDIQDELYQMFTRNLVDVQPSPALFNRWVINQWGSEDALMQVAN